MSEEIKKSPKFITYVFTDEEHGSLLTFTQPLLENDPEVDAAPNMRFYLAMFTGDTPEKTFGLAQEYIDKEQEKNKDKIDYEAIAKREELRRDGSFVKFQDGSKIKIIGIEELQK